MQINIHSVPFSMLLMLLIAWILLSILFWSIKNKITPTATGAKARRLIFNHLPPIRKGSIVDLGSGWGTMAFALADKYPDHSVYGFETSPFPFFVARIRQALFPRNNLHLYRRDFFLEPLQEAALVYCYLYPGAMPRLQVDS